MEARSILKCLLQRMIPEMALSGGSRHRSEMSAMIVGADVRRTRRDRWPASLRFAVAGDITRVAPTDAWSQRGQALQVQVGPFPLSHPVSAMLRERVDPDLSGRLAVLRTCRRSDECRDDHCDKKQPAARHISLMDTIVDRAQMTGDHNSHSITGTARRLASAGAPQE
jgi:hypothetical protein